MDATAIAPADTDYDIEHIAAQAADLEKAINDWALPSLIPALRMLTRAAVVQQDRDALLVILDQAKKDGAALLDSTTADERATALARHDAEVAARALRDAATSWAEDPDSVGDNDKDARNWLRDRADALDGAE